MSAIRRPVRRYTPRRPKDPPAMAGAEVLERRYRWLGRWLLNSEPVGPAAELRALIAAKVERLDATAAPIAERLAKLEVYLAELGQLERASAFADRFPADRGPNGGHGR